MKLVPSLLITASFALAPALAGAQSHWDYEGATTGPASWGKLSPDNVMCDKGRNQSPLDINIGEVLHAAVKPLQPSYTANNKATIINNGHTVQVDFDAGNTLVVDKVPFTLKQMHFHAPSENQIGGRAFPMEAHFVHADAQGNLLVVAVMFQEGRENAELAKLAAALPANAGPASPLATPVSPLALLPKSLVYYRFNGSLTTPPCTEGVRWLVLKAPVTASKAQIEAVERAIKHHNNRPVQPLNARVIVD
jgi:carbonic anhydrase